MFLCVHVHLYLIIYLFICRYTFIAAYSIWYDSATAHLYFFNYGLLYLGICLKTYIPFCIRNHSCMPKNVTVHFCLLICIKAYLILCRLIQSHTSLFS
uniref:Uncharacterized protein n=1 Tax=Elizabethkingia anophelis TaxID=1117645 RepID=A0A455ZCK0_9FLAO|nr:TPA_exp: hypothetical protein [Elizabethkingia anophelis]